MSDDEFELVVDEAIQSIPDGFHQYMQDIVVDVEDMPDEETCRDMGIRDPRSLLGLYRGVPLTDRHVEDSGRLPDRIVIYKRNLERMCPDRETLRREIRITVLHEVGHYLGFDEDYLAEKGYA